MSDTLLFFETVGIGLICILFVGAWMDVFRVILRTEKIFWRAILTLLVLHWTSVVVVFHCLVWRDLPYHLGLVVFSVWLAIPMVFSLIFSLKRKKKKSEASS